MRIKVRLFAALAHRAGVRELDVDVPDNARVADLLDTLGQRHQAVADLRDRLAFAVNMTYVAADHPLAPGDEVALIPPVSGG